MFHNKERTLQQEVTSAQRSESLCVDEPARYASDKALICLLFLEAKISVSVLSVVPAPWMISSVLISHFYCCS